MERKLVCIIADQTRIMLSNMNITLHTCNMDTALFEMPMWKHLYHTLHSLDRWFINPERYVEPPFHEESMNSLDIQTKRALTREELIEYFKGIEPTIYSYLDGLTDDMLSEKPEGCRYTRLALVLGQYRHLMCHIGIINCTTINETGKWPKVVGLVADYPKNEDEYYE